MFNFEKISLGFSFPSVFFFILILALAAYVIYVYRYTVPAIPKGKRIFLIVLRSLALALLLFVIFEPILTLAKKRILEPVNLIFLDNSRSIQINDGTNRSQTVKDFVKGLKDNNLSGNTELYTFGSAASGLSYDSLKKLNFNEGSTNFSRIFSTISKINRNISSVVIVSDGVITDGSDPLQTAIRQNIPVFTVGVGDSTARNDVEVKNVLYNEMIYAQTPTSVVASISNTGFSNKNVNVSLYENNTFAAQKNISLSPDGIQNVDFTYTPKGSGEKKLSVVVSNTPGEFTYANNKKVFFINVLSNKVKVLVIAGSPSPDVSFIKNSLRADNNLSVNSITQYAPDKFVEKNDRQRLLDSANVLFLVGFPSRETSQQLLQSVLKEIGDKDKPYFLTLSSGVDFSRLKTLQNELSFTANNISGDYLEIQPDISASQSDNPLLQNNASNILDAWNNLPPVYQPNVNLQSKPESEIISKVKINNVVMNRPLILARTLGSKKSVSVLAKDIWRWKLETAMKNLDLFDRFILSSTKWLNTKEDHKQFSVKTTKKLYALGEQVEFNAQVYDQTFNPITDAYVKVAVKSGSNSYEVNLNSIGNGLYEGTFQTNQPGDYTFTGEGYRNNNKLGTDNGSFNVGETDIEMINPRMNSEYLTLLSNQTNGKFFYNSNYKQLYSILKDITARSSKDKIDVSSINLWSDEWLLIIAIIIFGLEWFFRKRWGML
ncbi:MAG: hypothetical protein P4L45_16735 [Ignavibacteriaceae bacterium]|nr:hypothetical protein [Ignavibacteriaceae bacterium]